MLNALRLKDGFALQDFGDRTGLPIDRLTESLRQAESKGWLERAGEGVRPTERGFDFLSDLQQLFLPPA
ncbi:MAG: oxygen-independent coproporphyrinogen III oxidase-like protein, partial [Proteobacteria bacterium]|nr:oxygen-independent coproporphyrinogen III oxidase-like protein [Pseudomonadota bacterium]